MAQSFWNFGDVSKAFSRTWIKLKLSHTYGHNLEGAKAAMLLSSRCSFLRLVYCWKVWFKKGTECVYRCVAVISSHIGSTYVPQSGLCFLIRRFRYNNFIVGICLKTVNPIRLLQTGTCSLQFCFVGFLVSFISLNWPTA